MDRLWSPWRSQYISSFSAKEEAGGSGCFLCDALAASPDMDTANLVVHRDEHAFVIMNRYPYNAGHCMIVPNEHRADFATLSGDVARDIMHLIQRTQRVLNSLYKPHGFNVGANLGRVAGAGVPDHIHFHIVPRWSGDTNFMPVLADIKVASESLDSTYVELATAFRAHE